MLSEPKTSSQISKKDMVFSQTSHKTHSILKVVDIDRSKANKNGSKDGLTGTITNGRPGVPAPPSPLPTGSFSQVYLKQEPLVEETMLHEKEYEYFQDLVMWCSTPAKEEQKIETIDLPKETEERAPHSDTLNTPISPLGWDAFGLNAPDLRAGFYTTAPIDPPTPTTGLTLGDSSPLYPGLDGGKELSFNLDNLPVVIEAESAIATDPWRVPEPAGFSALHNTEHTSTHVTYTLPFIDKEDSLELKMVTPKDVESSNGVIIAEYILNNIAGESGPHNKTSDEGLRLSVNVNAQPKWTADEINTPDILNYVEELEKQELPVVKPSANTQWLVPDECTFPSPAATPPPPEYEPITPKSETRSSDDDLNHSKRRRRRTSEDSDETYIPYEEQPSTRKYKRKKPNVTIQDMIVALKGSQELHKATTRRGRPPKRRESTVSSVCSTEDSMASSHENKYRELRDKNNEASKRSRMNRKLKELQMEELADELEEKNKRLSVRVEVLEDMTKRLKDALMMAMLNK